MRMIFPILLWLMLSCGQPGDSKSKGDFVGTDIRGTITTQFGGQTEMAGWVLALLEKPTGISRVAEADNGGIYKFRQVDTSKTQTMVLLTPDYVTSAMMSAPGPVDKTIRQYFNIKGTSFPRLINRGTIFSFSEEKNIKFINDRADDSNADTIPDGMDALSLADNNSSNVDTDLDGTVNRYDPDIDNDGVPNWFDPDDDKDSILDAFDFESNGDLINDSVQTVGDLFFDKGFEFIVAQIEISPEDADTNKNTMTFTAKVRDDAAPLSVQIRGPGALLNDANIELEGDDGVITPYAWDRRLLDDGLSEDSAEGDRLFARKITLADGKKPSGHQTFFFQLAYGNTKDPYFIEYPFVFPDIDLEDITASYEKNTRTVQLTGEPFGDIEDFVWSVNLYNSSDVKVWTSVAITGTTKFFQIPENVFQSGETYKVSVTAQSLDRVPGYATFIVHSLKTAIE